MRNYVFNVTVYFNSVQAQYCLYLILPINVTNLALSLYINGPLCSMEMGMGRNGNEHLGNPMRMGINHENGNGNGKDREMSPWEWDGMGLSKLIPSHL